MKKRCDLCLRPKAMLGGKFVRRGPLTRWYCAACAAKSEALDRARA